jgi:hypothetical protein
MVRIGIGIGFLSAGFVLALTGVSTTISMFEIFIRTGLAFILITGGMMMIVKSLHVQKGNRQKAASMD